jgi:antitoxin ParD1/3/4
MQVILPPELEQLVQRQINSGKYQSALDVLLAGVQLLDQQDINEPDPDQPDLSREELQMLQQIAQVGWDAAQRGELVEGASALKQIRANLHSRYASGA